MVWTVVYRDTDGNRASVEIESADRNAVFAELQRRGISAISVNEGKAKPTRQGHRMPGGGRVSARPYRGIAAGLTVVVCAVAVWLCLSPSEMERVPPGNAVEKKASAASAPPRVAPRESDAAEGVPRPEKPKRFWQLPTTNGLTEAQQHIWKVKNRPPPGITNNTSLFEAKPKYAIFDHDSENTIAAYLTITPGQTLVGSPTYGKKFTDDFLKSLVEPIIVTKDDDPETAALKRAVNETKIELKTRHDAGEDIGKILEQTHEELRQLSQYKMQIEDVLKETICSGDLTEAEFDLAIEAANKMLDEKGIAPMEFGPVSRRILLRHVKPENK